MARSIGGSEEKQLENEESVLRINPKQKRDDDDQGLQRSEISLSECVACFGMTWMKVVQ